MVASAIVSPWPPSGRRPGPAWAWAPPRPFPVHVWLAQRPLVPLASTPARPARSAGFQPARPDGPSAVLPTEPSSARSAGFQPARPDGSLPPLPLPEVSATVPARPPNLAEKLARLLGIPPLPSSVPPVRAAAVPHYDSSGGRASTRTGRAGWKPALHAGASSVGGVGNEPTGRAGWKPALQAGRVQTEGGLNHSPVDAGWKPALHAGATSSSQPAQSSKAAVAVSRLDLELRLLFSRGPLPLDDERLAALRDELDQRAWSLTSAIGAPRPADPAWPTVPRPDTPLEKRRARLVADVDLGLSMVEVSASRYPRPVRNVLLVRQASYIGRRLEEVLTDPAAGSFAQEWKYLLEGLRRRR
jgi:hypothetical protein